MEESGSWCEEATIKSWAKRTEESYQLQLALALRLSSQAASANDPSFLDWNSSDSNRGVSSFSDSPESLSHRFWIRASLILLILSEFTSRKISTIEVSLPHEFNCLRFSFRSDFEEDLVTMIF